MSHAAMMDDFYAAREAWELEAERVSIGYATELAEYSETHTRPRLGDFMGLRAVPDLLPDPRDYPGRELSDVAYAGCEHGWHEWHAEMYVARRRSRYRVVVRCYTDDTWSRHIVWVLKSATPAVTGRELDDTLNRWADDCLLAAKRM